MERPVRAIVTFILLGALVPIYQLRTAPLSLHWLWRDGHLFLLFTSIMLLLNIVAIIQLAFKYFIMMSEKPATH
jgi:hypothetical protein